jgi:hypothetical protein
MVLILQEIFCSTTRTGALELQMAMTMEELAKKFNGFKVMM